MRYVLLIPGWFPSRVNFLAGDFIERHARAASLFFPVKVLFVVKDNSLPFGTTGLVHKKHSDSYECFIYYYSSKSKSKWLEKAVSAWLQARCLSKGFRHIIKENGLPSLIHAHVLVKYAWFALRQSKKWAIPLLASEQWTGYLPGAEHEFKSLTAFQRRTIKTALEQSVHLTTVSGYLAQSIRRRFTYKNHTVIPNLVDTSLFYPRQRADNNPCTFIHISTLSLQKNFDEILQACAILKKQRAAFRLVVVAPRHGFYEKLVAEMNLSAEVVFRKEVPQEELAQSMAEADALVLYSRYETFGCVIVEANACGVPVIVSDFPVFEENVQEGVTGCRVPLHHPQALADCMMKFINKQYSFDKAAIVRITKEKYSFEVVGKQFADVYNRYAKP